MNLLVFGVVALVFVFILLTIAKNRSKSQVPKTTTYKDEWGTVTINHEIEKSPDPRSEFLTRFLGCSTIEEYDTEYWAARLGQNPKVLFNELLEKKLIVPARLEEVLDLRHSTSKLKNMLRERKLKISGNKEALVNRLIEACPEEMKKLCSEKQFFICSEEGRFIAQKYWERTHGPSDASNAIKSVLKGGNIKSEEFMDERANAQGIPDNDIMWGLLNKKLHFYMKEGDWQGMKLIYYDMASFLQEEGRSFFRMLKQAHKCELMSYKETNFAKTELITAREGTCDVCSKFEGKILTVDEALSTMPIPAKDCKNGWCRCCYNPVPR